MTRVIVLRPQPGAGQTAARAQALGLEAQVHPLFAAQAIDWSAPPATAFDAIVLTSANAAHLGGDMLAAYRSLPAYAVGEATAKAMRAHGFAHVVAGSGDGSAIAARIAADGHRRVLHPGGVTVALIEAGPLTITRVAVYAMAGVEPGPGLIADAEPGSVLLVHSPRAGERLAALIPPAERARLHLVAISPAALAACGDCWATRQSPDLPRDDDMLALAARLCEGTSGKAMKG